jgi:hypothetical protein
MKSNKKMTAAEVNTLFDAAVKAVETVFTDPDFDGATYGKARDKVRLGKQLEDVFVFLDTNKGWWTLSHIRGNTGYPEASISARIRDLRKAKFGGHEIPRRYVKRGLWEYRLVK